LIVYYSIIITDLHQLIITADGSHTIYVPELNEHYHSIHGAIGESRHIFINYGYHFSKADPLNILEIGFGTGLNVLLTCLQSAQDNRKINYTSVEKHPLPDEIVQALNYKLFTDESGEKLFNRIHSSQWNCAQNISENFNLTKFHGALMEIDLPCGYDLLYFDAFGPEKQPEMWTREVFDMISSRMVKKGTLVTYCAKGEVKRNLRYCGFEVTLLPGPPGKREIIRAVKI
jgi:tRNA U34 5-methylaminomethyl-2-thiouridine-forming methyltransferase MnmC